MRDESYVEFIKQVTTTEDGPTRNVTINTTIKDSGARREFNSGAVRDIQEGKGRFDLMPLNVAACLLDEPDAILLYINDFIRNGTDYSLYLALNCFINEYYEGNVWDALLDVSLHYEQGAKKYDDRNWEKGIPMHCYIDSAVRHYVKHKAEWRDESHDRAFMWNLMGCLWTHKEFGGDYMTEYIFDLPFSFRQSEPETEDPNE